MSEAQAITILKDALATAKQTIRSQGAMLKRLTKEPLRFATVVAIRSPDPVQEPAPPVVIPQDFTAGAKVRFLRGARKGKIGEIAPSRQPHGDVVVMVEGEWVVCNVDPTHLTRVSDMFAEPTDRNLPLATGAELRVTHGTHAGLVGKLQAEPNERNVAPLLFSKGCPNRLDGCVHNYCIDAPLVIELVDAATAAPTRTAIVLFDGKEVEVALPTEKLVQVGDTVKLSMQSLQIVDVVSTLLAGEVVGIQKVLDDASCEVDFQGGTRAVYSGRFGGQLADGDRVVLDPSGLVVIRNLGREDKKDTLFAFTEDTNVSWESIGGLADAKRQLIEAIELPMRYGAHYRFYRKKPLKGLLLYGPPGCGKTMLGKAAATALASLHGGRGRESAFLYVKAPEILNKFIGTSEATVRRIFAAARAHKAAHGYPAVVFVDEADAILGRRGSGISSDIERTLVPMFLAEMDGFHESGALMLLATNRADTLDPAVTRDGRIDRKVKVDRPTPATAAEIFRLNLTGIPLNNGHSCDSLAAHATAELFNPTRVLYELRLKDGSAEHFTFGHLASGALIAGIVDRATSLAISSDIDQERDPQGLRLEHLDDAVQNAFHEVRDLNHDDEVREFASAFGREVVRVETRRISAGGAA